MFTQQHFFLSSRGECCHNDKRDFMKLPEAVKAFKACHYEFGL